MFFFITAEGSYICECKDGWIKNEEEEDSCEDVDECIQGNVECMKNGECRLLFFLGFPGLN